MDGGWLARIRWRRRGAWMWPSFMALTAIDGAIGTTFPPQGSSWAFFGAFLFGGFANLFAIVALSVPPSLALRRLRPDLPKVVAHDYAGTATMTAITAALLAAGIVHRSGIQAEKRASRDATVRAQAFIGAHAGERFRREVQYVSTLAIQPGRIYRVCVPDTVPAPTSQWYCVSVDERRPFAQSVSYSGSESNVMLDQGVQ
jgi:hypothetical protein